MGRLFSIISFVVLVYGVVLSMGCTGAQKGGGTGAVVGAGIGAIIGHQSGETATGAAVGAAVGGLAGAIAGDAIEKNSQTAAPRPASQNQVVVKQAEDPQVVVERKVKFCPVCGREYPSDMEYCPKCGVKLLYKQEQ